MKFECKKCGKCCREFEEGESGGLSLFEFERDSFLNKARELGVSNRIFIRRPHNGVLGAYEVRFEGVCPFLKNNECMINQEKPMHCKAFPIDWFMEIEEEERANIEFNFKCDNVIDLRGKRLRSEFYREMYESYGDAFLVSIEMDIVASLIIGMRKEMEYYNPDKMFFRQLISSKAMSEEYYNQFVKEIKECKHARDQINALFENKGWKKI